MIATGVDLPALVAASHFLAKASGVDAATMESIVRKIERRARHATLVALIAAPANDGDHGL